MKIRFALCSLFLILILFLSACTNPVAGNSESVVFDGLSITWGDNGSPVSLSKFAGSYSSSSGTYDFNDDGTGNITGANPSVRASGGSTPFTWEIIAENANNANITDGMLYVGNTGSGITFDTGKTPNTVTINGIEYGKGGMPIGGGDSSGSGGGGSLGGGNTGGDSSGSSGGSSSGGQSGGSGGSSGSTPESTPTDIGNGNWQLFAPGVSLASGWHDVNKTGGDNDLCWAATSSNLVAWWQDLYIKNVEQLPTSVKTMDTEIFSLFKTNFGNTSGTYVNGVPWYFVDSSSGRCGAYLFNCVNPQDWNPIFTKAYKIVEDTSNNRRFTTIADFSNEVVAGLKKGAMGLKLTKSGQGGHAITLWGVEYNTSNQIIAVYVTDSDDHLAELKRYELEQKTDSIMLKNYSVDGWQLDKIHGIMILYAP